MNRRLGVMLFGFVFALVGAWFLAVRPCGVRETGLLVGMAA